jgi:hypothetical protein
MVAVTRNPLIAVLLAGAIAACGGGARGSYDFEQHIGLVVTDMDGVACLRSPGAWQPGESLTLIGTQEGQGIAEGTIRAPVELCAEERLLENLPGRHALSATGLAPGRIWFAVPRVPTTAAGQNLDLDGDGEAETFRVCNSTEGLHFSVWTGAPGAGTRRWHRYWYVGYDMVPTCTDADFPGT